jgi:subtilase family serine protease
MRKVVGCAALAALIACGSEIGDTTSSTAEALGAIPAQAAPHVPICPGPAAAGDARCHSHVITDERATPFATTAPTGLNPADLVSAYQIPSLAANAATPTIGIVDAFDDPNAESDMNVYRAQFGLPACTTANGCFRKVNQRGVQGAYPRKNQGWGLEISLDLDMASAICPACHILLVEADSNSLANLGASVNTAVALGATVVSNSYGGGEFAGEQNDQDYNHPGHAITASSGDAGFGVEFPAASGFVTAVGGTSLRRAANARGWTETAWSGAGSGCSAFVPKPAWQNDTGCPRRTIADVSAVADPNAGGVSVFDSFGFQGQKGWFVVGGTSASAPIIASVYAIAGNAATVDYASFPYAHTASLFDVTSGSNGTCSPAYLCTAGVGYDGPTGLGTPNGTGAF